MKILMNVRIFILYTLVFLLAMSCEETVSNFEIKDQPTKIVLNAVLNPDSIFKINLSKSLSIDDPTNVVPGINNALIEVYENGDLLGDMDYIGDGYYVLEGHRPIPGNKYRIYASVPGLNSVSSEMIMPGKPNAENITTEFLKGIGEPNCMGCGVSNFLEFRISMSKTPGLDQFYAVSLSAEELLTNCMQYICDTKFNEEFQYYYDSCYCTEIDTIGTRIETLDIETYNNLTKFTGNYGNFYLSSINYESYGTKLFLTDESIIDGGYTYTFRIHESNLYRFKDTGKFTLILESIDKAYFSFLHSLARVYEVDGDPFAEKVTIFSNIENGLGVFSGIATHVVEFEIDIESILVNNY